MAVIGCRPSGDWVSVHHAMSEAFSIRENSQGEIILSYDPFKYNGVPPTEASIEELIDNSYSKVERIKGAIQYFVQNFDPSLENSVIVGQKKDGDCDLFVSSDKYRVEIVVRAPKGGEPFSEDQLRKLLSQNRVIYGIKEDVISSLSNPDNWDKPILVAEGDPPVHGQPTVFEPVVKVNRTRVPRHREDGKVDLMDFGSIPVVNAGDVLMVRHPATQGESGRNVYGEVVRPKPAKDVPFNRKLSGSQINPSNVNEIVASITGQPVMLKDGCNVEPIIRVKEVGAESGHIDFVGSLNVSGDVQNGMVVRVGGDIIVEGTIAAAQVNAGGNIVAKGGIIGQIHRQGEDDQLEARVDAKGSIHAHHIENAAVTSEKAIMVDIAIVQSEVVALETVTVGKSGKGKILGGEVQAMQGIKTMFIGGKGSSKTTVRSGVNPLLQKKIDRQKKIIEDKVKEQESLVKLIDILKSDPAKKEMLDKAKQTLSAVSEEIVDAYEEKRALDQDVLLADSSEIEATGGCFSGSIISIAGKVMIIKDDVGPGIFRLSGAEVEFQSKRRKK